MSRSPRRKAIKRAQFARKVRARRMRKFAEIIANGATLVLNREDFDALPRAETPLPLLGAIYGTVPVSVSPYLKRGEWLAVKPMDTLERMASERFGREK